MMSPPRRPADRIVSGLRVARGTLIAARECLADAHEIAVATKAAARLVEALAEGMEFADRGAGRLQVVHAAIEEELVRLGVKITLGGPARAVLPAASRAGANRPPTYPARRRRPRTKRPRPKRPGPPARSRGH